MFNKSRIVRAVIAAAILCCTVSLTPVSWRPAAVRAQQQRPERKRAEQLEVMRKVTQALKHLSSDPDKSLEILRNLDKQYPGNGRIIYRIGYAFHVMGRTDSAEVYYKRTLRIDGGNIEAGKSLGAMYLAGGRSDDAMIVFDQLLGANKHHVGAYKAVGNALRDANMHEEALAIYREGRGRSKQHFALTMEIAELHRTAKQYDEALREYLLYADERQGSYRFTRERIMDMMREVGDAERIGLIEILDARLDSGTGAKYVTLDILAALYLAQGMLEQALDAAIRADDEKKSEGTVLLALANQVITAAGARPREDRRRYLDMGVRALSAYSTNHPKANGSDRAKYMLAGIYVKYGSGEAPEADDARGQTGTGGSRDVSRERTAWIEKAIAQYADLAKRHPGSEYAERANLERGNLLLHRLKDPKRALEAFKVGAINSRRYGDIFAARIADVYLGTSEYEDAEHYITSLKRSGVKLLKQTGAYYTGIMLAFKGEYEAARDTLSALADSDPGSPYTNDAIELAWVIEEALQYGSTSLGVFLNARQAEMLGDTTVVTAQLGGIVAGQPNDTLRPRALFKLGKIRYESGDYDGAIECYNKFLGDFVDDALRPDVQRAIAAVYEFGYERYERALREYELVLTLYPDYAFLDEVRKDVRRLRYIVEGKE